jgi:hypothetical protein
MVVPMYQKTTAPSVGCLPRNTKYNGNAKASHEAIQCNHIARKGTVDSTCSHFIMYLEIQTSDDLCIASYCDNQSLVKNEGIFHSRDIESSSWYTNPVHDVIMTLSALRHRYTSAGTETDIANSTFSHDLHSSMSLPTNSIPKYSRTSEHRINLSRSTHYPHAASTYVMTQGTSQATKNARSRIEFPKYEIRAYLQQRNGWTTHTLDPINWTAYQAAISGLTD